MEKRKKKKRKNQTVKRTVIKKDLIRKKVNWINSKAFTISAKLILNPL
jgi:hypothetical protein